MYCGAELCAKGIKFRFTFGFFAVWAILIIGYGSSETAAITMISCLLHELGHIGAMKLSGVKVRRLVFYSGGIALTSDPPTEYTDIRREIMILSAGCAVNMMIFAAAYFSGSTLWALVNLSLALFNLLPFSPLDGGRIIKALASHICPTADICGAQKIFDIIFGTAAAAFFIARGNINFTLPLTLALIILEGIADKSI